MLIAHLPAGYLCTRALLQPYKNRISASEYATYFGAGLLGSVLPDFDIIYFYCRYYLTGKWWPPHHEYWSHIPFNWITIFACLLVICRIYKRQKFMTGLHIAGINLLVHFGFDTFPGRIKWLYPFSKERFGVFRIPLHSERWWVWDHMWHWTFGIELAIIAAGVYLVIRDLRAIDILKKIRMAETF